MRSLICAALAIFLGCPALCQGQVGGNASFSSQGNGASERAEQHERERRTLTEIDKPPTGTSSFVTANILMNLKADEFVAVFGLAEEGETVADCSQKMDTVAKDLTAAIKALGVAEDDLFLDFVTQSKVYGYEITDAIAREKLVGFELKKNLSVHYKDRDLLDKLTVAAAKFKVYDLIKVDYVVRDIKPIQDQMMEAAAKVIKHKTDRYEKLLGIKLQPPAQIFAEKYATYYPSKMYDSYTAAESEHLYGIDRQRYTVQSARKSRTFHFNGLDGSEFDEVINPVIIEPVVQVTLHLKIKYEVEQLKAK